MNTPYDTIGDGYALRRRSDPRVLRQMSRRLGEPASVLNVGAGTGSYEPADVPVVAVEPSRTMIAQRTSSAPVVQATAEALPFADATFDAVMAVLTVHHWRDQRRGLRECRRVARRRVCILTWDPDSDGFWLVQDYFPAILELDRRILPPLDAFRDALGPISVEHVPVPADCVDGFLGAFWRRPAAYLDAAVRSGMSSFLRIGDVRPGVEALRRDLDSGAWQDRHGHLLSLDELDMGYRIVTAEVG